MKTVGWYGVIFLSLSPLLFWVGMEPLSVRFISPQLILRSIGEVTGLVGTSMFAIDFVLSARAKWMERFFGGLNRVYLAHHLFGGIAFILLLIHPLFLAGMYALDSLRSAALFLLPGNDWTINFGIAGLFLMIALLMITFYALLPYNLWKLSHKILGLAFFLGAVHGIFVSSDISQHVPLLWYMGILIGIGAVAYIFQVFLSPFFVKKAVYTVVQVKELESNVVEIDMQPVKNPIHYESGQFIFIAFKDKNVSSEMHPFSLSSAPIDGQLQIVVKAEGDYTSSLKNLQPGARAYIEGPFGVFQYQQCDNNSQIWIGGGIGITPFISMAKTLGDHPSIQVDLYYTMHDEKEGVYVQDLETISKQHANLSFAPYYTATKGRLTAKVIADASGDITRKDIFLCGPPLMMHSLVDQFKKLGVPAKRIHSEEFSWE